MSRAENEKLGRKDNETLHILHTHEKIFVKMLKRIFQTTLIPRVDPKVHVNRKMLGEKLKIFFCTCEVKFVKKCRLSFFSKKFSYFIQILISQKKLIKESILIFTLDYLNFFRNFYLVIYPCRSTLVFSFRFIKRFH